MRIEENPKVLEFFKCDTTGPTVCGLCYTSNPSPCQRVSAAILAAMQEQIKEGDRYLRVDEEYEVKEFENEEGDGFYGSFHPNALRLPSQLQPTWEMHKRPHCNCRTPVDPSITSPCCYCQEIMAWPQPEAGRCENYKNNGVDWFCSTCGKAKYDKAHTPVDAVEDRKVEDKIQEIKNKLKSWADAYLEGHLRELLALARSK